MSKTKSTPAYLTLIVDILERSAALGFAVERDMGTMSTLPENRGYCFVRVDGGTAALIVPKHADEVKYCDSHIDWEGEDGYVPLTKENGAVICRIDPSETDLDQFLTQLSGASVRKRKPTVKGQSVDMTALLAKLQSLGLPKVEAMAAAAQTVEGHAPELEHLIEETELA